MRGTESRRYKVYLSPAGKVCRSKLDAWRHYDTAGSGPLGQPVVENMVPPPDQLSPTKFRIPYTVTWELRALVRSLGLLVEDLPRGVVDCVQASRSDEVADTLRVLAADRVSTFGRERISSSGPPVPALPLPPQAIVDATAREIKLLRAELPLGCEKRMLGKQDWSLNQLPPYLRARVLNGKFVNAAGRAGAHCARDRRALARYKKFARACNISPPFPVGGATLLLFAQAAAQDSTGKKGGLTVAHSLKTAFASLKNHWGLEVELDAPVLFNNIKAYQGFSDTATSPSPWAYSRWCFLAVHAPSQTARVACQMAVLACNLTLRSIHFVGASVLVSSTAERVRVNLANDKDGSTDVWAGCDAVGSDGPLLWWPAFMAEAVARGYLIPEFSASGEVSLASVTVSASPVTSAGMVIAVKLAFLLVGVSLEEQLNLYFTGHSFRHFLPCIAELLMWPAPLRDELGRWSTGAANQRKAKCGRRYTFEANRALQIFLRRYVLEAVVFIISIPTEIPDSPLPAFDVLAATDEVRKCPHFGHGAIVRVPGFGLVS